MPFLVEHFAEGRRRPQAPASGPADEASPCASGAGAPAARGRGVRAPHALDHIYERRAWVEHCAFGRAAPAGSPQGSP